MAAMVKCPWCTVSSKYGYDIIEHCREAHKDKIASEPEAYVCPFCNECVQLAADSKSTDMLGRHVASCPAYAAALLSGCSMRGDHDR